MELPQILTSQVRKPGSNTCSGSIPTTRERSSMPSNVYDMLESMIGGDEQTLLDNGLSMEEILQYLMENDTKYDYFLFLVGQVRLQHLNQLLRHSRLKNFQILSILLRLRNRNALSAKKRMCSRMQLSKCLVSISFMTIVS